MGFTEIYLIGVDHSFAKTIDRDGNIIIDNTIQDHFANDYSAGIQDTGFRVDAVTDAYISVEQWSRSKGTFRVYNATRGGKLEVFERVDLDSLISSL